MDELISQFYQSLVTISKFRVVLKNITDHEFPRKQIVATDLRAAIYAKTNFRRMNPFLF